MTGGVANWDPSPKMPEGRKDEEYDDEGGKEENEEKKNDEGKEIASSKTTHTSKQDGSKAIDIAEAISEFCLKLSTT